MRAPLNAVVLLFAGLLLMTGTASAQRLELVIRGLSSPVSITNAGDARLFVVEQAGTIRIVSGGNVVATPFLSIADRVRSGGEQGLLGLAFPPDHAATGRYYVYYTDRNGHTVVSRFTANGNTTDPATEQVLLTQTQPYSNHNGGQLAFGPDGYLYVGLGDGGSGGDPEGNGQDLTTFLAKLLRIDVSGDMYMVPPDNPFVGRGDARPEIWAYGLRNPWRFSFDSVTGDLFIADVGQNAFEEVNLQRAGSPGGENYGWKIMEANACYEPSRNCDRTGLVVPILEYPHASGWGQSISGGYVYRGPDAPSLTGAYVFGDYVSGRIWTARAENGWRPTLLLESGMNISTFGVGAKGELYVADHSRGALYLLTD